MFLEARDLLHRPPRVYDVCIVGSGPAGLSLAHALRGSGLEICVVESGGRAAMDRLNALCDVESVGIQIRSDSRERVLGGTSTTWSGLSSPLDDIDFRRRSWVPHSGWPVTRDELVPYYQSASRLFRFPSWEHLTHASWLPDRDGRIPRWDGIEEKPFLATDPPQDFSKECASVLREPALDVVLNATVTNLEGDGGHGEARGVRVALPGGQSAIIAARVTVLACGGIENARLLLNSTFACAAGLGNDRDQVGRYFMNHPKANYGVIRLRKPQGALPGYFGFLLPGLGYAGYVGLRLTPSLQERQEVLNSYVRFEPEFDWSDDPGVKAFVYYLKHSTMLMAAFRRANRNRVVELRSYAETGDDSESTPSPEGVAPCVARLTQIAQHWRAVSRYARSRLLHREPPTVTSVRLRNFLEMAPDPANRVTLTDRADAYGMRLPLVRHECGEIDKRSIVALHQRLKEEIEAADWGRVDSDLTTGSEPWPINQEASHHMGATRMGTDPATSVVDPNCRLHSTSTVYVAGASVFPTSGCANPTYTVVALALRLGDHIKSRLA